MIPNSLRLFAVTVTVVFSGGVFAGEADYKAQVKSTMLLQTDTTAAGQPIRYLPTDKPEVTVRIVEIPPGGETGWHTHPVPGYGYILSGQLTLEVEGKKTLTFDSGQAVIESVDLLHNGKNLGTKPLKILAFFTGEAGKPHTIKK
jgi:quercetin dioxygenase-like cupin family protein